MNPRSFFVVGLLAAFTVLTFSTADARPRHHRVKHQRVVSLPAVAPCTYSNDGRTVCSGAAERRISTSSMYVLDEGRIVGHPAGCPRRAFCGCGVSVKAFGKPIRELFLASNYGYYFNEGAFVPGNAVWRYGHVAYILGGTREAALLYDPNSGGGKTRIHTVDARRYRIADLSSPKRRLASR